MRTFLRQIGNIYGVCHSVRPIYTGHKTSKICVVILNKTVEGHKINGAYNVK